jgi:predicted 2-oxoglutarate/Fe(II)-dependent dioxygenase YbiX
VFDTLAIPLFDAAACEAMLVELQAERGQPATVYGATIAGAIDPSVRKVSRLIPSPVMRASVIQALIGQKPAIAGHFQVDLGAAEEPQFLRYLSGDYFVAHQDGNTSLIRDDARFRRVSVVIFLNAQSNEGAPRTYGGGSLVLHGSYPRYELRQPLAATPGTLVAFPSETTHEVTPVVRGERYTIVSWYRAAEEPGGA